MMRNDLLLRCPNKWAPTALAATIGQSLPRCTPTTRRPLPRRSLYNHAIAVAAQHIATIRSNNSSSQSPWRQGLHAHDGPNRSWLLPMSVVASSGLCLQCRVDPSLLFDPVIRHYQVRWKGRNDGNKWQNSGKERTPTKKQRKKYHRHLQSIQAAKDKHGAPGYKAGPRREWNQMVKDDLLRDDNDGNSTSDPLFSPDYGAADALLDDVMGNTIAAADTPEPTYLGHKHRQYFNAVADHMDDYRNYQEQQQQLRLASTSDIDSSNSTGENAVAMMDPNAIGLPPDEMIARAVRAFRDLNGTRQCPVGLIAALSHVIQDLGVPVVALGEYTYTALLTCCRSPKEARRILQMIREQGLPISAYSWSILVDIHAKTGDYQGCIDVQQEMLQAGVPPTLASYTSLLAACYKVCIDGRVSHAIRAQAADDGWRKWQEMRIVGVEPDVMAYGAILRLKAAVGQPELCVNLLEEMPRFGVAPTTLCFTSALRAVARSHATAIRYEKGASRRNRRREFLTQHHGKLARHVLILAESASVVQDDGFVAALCLCAAAAGDVATAKAIYVASQIRRQDAFRTIGSNEHLAQLRGESTSAIATIGRDDTTAALELPMSTATHQQYAHSSLERHDASEYMDGTFRDQELVEQTSDGESGPMMREFRPKAYPSFGEREYGKDSRVLSAVLHACAQAVHQNGIGTMWQGRENKGYLCINSLRLIATPKVPEYHDNSIPGQKITDNLTWSGEHTEGYREGKRKSRKFEGVEVDENVGSTLDDLDEYFSNMYLDDDGRLKEEYQKTTYNEIWNLKYGENGNGSADANVVQVGQGRQDSIAKAERIPSGIHSDDARDEIFFDDETMRRRTLASSVSKTGESEGLSMSDSNPSIGRVQQREKSAVPDMVFDYETMRWKSIDATDETLKRSVVAVPSSAELDVSSDSDSDSDESDSSDSESDDSATESASFDDVYFDHKERRWKTRDENQNQDRTLSTDFDSTTFVATFEPDDISKHDARDDETVRESEEGAFLMFYSDLKDEAHKSGQESVTEDEARELFAMMRDDYDEMMSKPPEELGIDHLASSSTNSPPASMGYKQHQPMGAMQPELASTTTFMYEHEHEFDEPVHEKFDIADFATVSSLQSASADSYPVGNAQEDSDPADAQLAELRRLLPALSDARLCKILRVFQKSLGDPHLLDLIPIVRENLPDYVTATWLKQMSALTAKFVVHKASQDGLVNVELLNTALELLASSGSLDRALAFHHSEFGHHGLQPTSFSDRLVLQMLLTNNRFSRALAFKNAVEKDGRSIDLKGYGSLIEHCSRRGQLGSSLLLLKECMSVHGSAPGEASLTNLRLLHRQVDSADSAALEAMIGPDPVEWLRHGEANLKREMSKHGRRNVQLARNRLVRL